MDGECVCAACSTAAQALGKVMPYLLQYLLALPLALAHAGCHYAKKQPRF